MDCIYWGYILQWTSSGVVWFSLGKTDGSRSRCVWTLKQFGFMVLFTSVLLLGLCLIPHRTWVFCIIMQTESFLYMFCADFVGDSRFIIWLHWDLQRKHSQHWQTSNILSLFKYVMFKILLASCFCVKIYILVHCKLVYVPVFGKIQTNITLLLAWSAVNIFFFHQIGEILYTLKIFGGIYHIHITRIV